MFRQILAIVVLISFLPYSAIAQTQTSTVGKFTRLKKGIPAPFEGYLLDNVASAEVLTHKKYAEKEYNTKLSFQLEQLRLEKDKEIAKLQSELRIKKDEHITMIDIKNQQIQQTIQATVGTPKLDLTWLWVSLSFLAGVGITVLGIWGASKLKGEGIIINSP